MSSSECRFSCSRNSLNSSLKPSGDLLLCMRKRGGYGLVKEIVDVHSLPATAADTIFAGRPSRGTRLVPRQTGRVQEAARSWYGYACENVTAIRIIARVPGLDTLTVVWPARAMMRVGI